MKTKIVNGCRGVPLVALAILLTGCATSALWKSTAAREWKPNRPDQIILIMDTNQRSEVVVLFRQFAVAGKTSDSRTAAWRVGQSPDELTLSTEAIGRLTNSFRQYTPVPMFIDEPESQHLLPGSPGYAVWHPMDEQLTLHISGQPTEPFTLPTSHQQRQTALRVCALPVAVAADTALAGAALLAVGMVCYVGGP